MSVVTKAWDASLHPRGQPDNAGQFAAGGGAAVATHDDPPRTPKDSKDSKELPKLKFGGEPPPKDKPVVLVFGGSFNPPTTAHVQVAKDSMRMLEKEGYNVKNVVVAPSPDKLLRAKYTKDGQNPDMAYPISERLELLRRSIDDDRLVPSDGPAIDAENTVGKLARTQLADWAKKEYPGATVVAVTGEDQATGTGHSPPGFPSLYVGDAGTKHAGYYYLALPRDSENGVSSSKIRKQIRNGEKITDMAPAAIDYLERMFEANPKIAKSVKAVWDESKHPRGQPENAGWFAAVGGSSIADAPIADAPVGAVVGPASTPVPESGPVSVDTEAFSGRVSPANYGEASRAGRRIAGMEKIHQSGAVVPDAAVKLMQTHDQEATRRFVAAISEGNIPWALKEFQDTPLYDLQVLGGITVRDSAVPGRAVCQMNSREITMGQGSKTGDFRHELGHAIRAAMGGESGYDGKTFITKMVKDEFKKVQERIAADPSLMNGHGHVDTDALQKAYGIVSARGADNWEENFAEQYRGYHRALFRDRKEGGTKHLDNYKAWNPGFAKIWDVWYSGALRGQTQAHADAMKLDATVAPLTETPGDVPPKKQPSVSAQKPPAKKPPTKKPTPAPTLPPIPQFINADKKIRKLNIDAANHLLNLAQAGNVSQIAAFQSPSNMVRQYRDQLVAYLQQKKKAKSASGINCGTGAGGFQPGNTCAHEDGAAHGNTSEIVDLRNIHSKKPTTPHDGSTVTVPVSRDDKLALLEKIGGAYDLDEVKQWPDSTVDKIIESRVADHNYNMKIIAAIPSRAIRMEIETSRKNVAEALDDAKRMSMSDKAAAMYQKREQVILDAKLARLKQLGIEGTANAKIDRQTLTYTPAKTIKEAEAFWNGKGVLCKWEMDQGAAEPESQYHKHYSVDDVNAINSVIVDMVKKYPKFNLTTLGLMYGIDKAQWDESVNYGMVQEQLDFERSGKKRFMAAAAKKRVIKKMVPEPPIKYDEANDKMYYDHYSLFRLADASHEGVLRFNHRSRSMADKDTAGRDRARSGGDPADGVNNTIAGVALHESAHILDTSYGLRTNPEIVKLYESLQNPAGHERIRRELSVYADANDERPGRHNLAEFIAEAYVESNMPNPSPLGKEVRALIDKVTQA